MPEQWQLQEALQQGIEGRRIRQKNIEQALIHQLAGEQAITDSVKLDHPLIQKMAAIASEQFVLIEELLIRADVRLGHIGETENIRSIIQERYATNLMESNLAIEALDPRVMAQHISLMPPKVVQKCFGIEYLLQEQRLIILRALDDLRPEANE